MKRTRVLAITLAVVALLLGGMVVMYAFGTPQAGSPPVARADAGLAGAADAAGMPGVTGSVVATGAAVPEPDPSTPLAIEIPGCVCHSDDPQLVEEHAQYRMNQCFGCHADGMPEMAQ